MKHLLIFCLLSLLSLSATAQKRRIYYVGTNQIAIADSAGGRLSLRPVATLTVEVAGQSVNIAQNGASLFLLNADQFLNASGVAYSTVSALAAVNAFRLTVPVSGVDSTARSTASTALATANSATATGAANATAIIRAIPAVVATFAAAQAATTPGVPKEFIITLNSDQNINSKTYSVYDGTNWHHSPSL